MALRGWCSKKSALSFKETFLLTVHLTNACIIITVIIVVVGLRVIQHFKCSLFASHHVSKCDIDWDSLTEAPHKMWTANMVESWHVAGVMLDISSSMLELSRLPRDYWQWIEALSHAENNGCGFVRFAIILYQSSLTVVSAIVICFNFRMYKIQFFRCSSAYKKDLCCSHF